ncbi:hypothetical protein SDC9_198971 [bioreactor metagenome]|uniref:Uncharacterized protein n=1 Tax=bioreactor metagenome TaxID=1076179 RepID=A0A645IJ62_9ZZZZ
MGLDELAVNAGQVDLAQVDAGLGMGLPPGDDGEQAWPGLGQRQRLERAFLQPGQQGRAGLPGALGQARELRPVVLLAQPGDGAFRRVDPGCRR